MIAMGVDELNIETVKYKLEVLSKEAPGIEL